MVVLAWRLLGTSIVLAGGAVALAEPPKSEVNGRATPAITQDHFQPESAPTPRVLPQQVRDPRPSNTTPPTAIWPAGVVGLRLPHALPVDLDVPIRVFGSGGRVPGLAADRDWRARAALDVAEMHFRACDPAEARNWYREVIKLAPDSEYAGRAAERLKDTDVRPAASQSEEPPLADAQELQVRVRIP